MWEVEIKAHSNIYGGLGAYPKEKFHLYSSESVMLDTIDSQRNDGWLF